MPQCPFHVVDPCSGAPAAENSDLSSAVDELAFLGEAYGGAAPADRLVQLRQALERGEPAPLTTSELHWAGKIAWRNHARCIGRLHWASLTVRDQREVHTAAAIAESLLEHLALAQNNGQIRSVLTLFAPPDSPGGAAPRIWNQQLCAYACHRAADGSLLGDPRNRRLTEIALALGWRVPDTPGPFDLLPWIIAGRDGLPCLFPIPPGAVREVPLRHPDHPGIERLRLRWYAVPVIADMRLRAAGTDFPAAPFNGWYMGTEIGARNLADVERYNLLRVVAAAMGIDTSRRRSLWQDRALVELNVAVLHSYAAAGVTLVDHHAAAEEFMRFVAREREAGREVSARWDWIVPPVSPATTPVFHTPMKERPNSPDFHPQAPPPWPPEEIRP